MFLTILISPGTQWEHLVFLNISSLLGQIHFVSYLSAENMSTKIKSRIRALVWGWTHEFEKHVRAEPPPQGGIEEVQADLGEAGIEPSSSIRSRIIH